MSNYEQVLPLSVIAPWPAEQAAKAAALLESARQGDQHKIVVLDDDPTGVQTVHGISVYTHWDQQSLDEAFKEEQPLFFVLTNSRGMSRAESRQTQEDIALRLLKSAEKTGKPFTVISRSDSTMRGHYPTETETLRETLERHSSPRFDGEIICPFFLEGGRYTLNNVHYVQESDKLVPAAQTEFARDPSFGYAHSHLGQWCEEKTGGRYRAEDMCYIPLEMLRALDQEGVKERLMAVTGFGKVIVNATAYEDLMVFLAGYLEAVKAGKCFLFRSAAAVPKVLGGISTKPLLDRAALQAEGGRGGLVVIGSHVQKTTRQMEALLRGRPDILAYEFRVAEALQPGGLERERERLGHLVQEGLEAGQTVLVYTSRELLETDGSSEEKLRLSVAISEALTGVVAGLEARPGFLIAKGGITSSDIGVKALRVRRALVLGQILPGVPVWQTDERSKYPGLPYVIFPGNVGAVDGLLEAVNKLTK